MKGDGYSADGRGNVLEDLLKLVGHFFAFLGPRFFPLSLLGFFGAEPALLAISLRCSAVSLAALLTPPISPPSRPKWAMTALICFSVAM